MFSLLDKLGEEREMQEGDYGEYEEEYEDEDEEDSGYESDDEDDDVEWDDEEEDEEDMVVWDDEEEEDGDANLPGLAGGNDAEDAEALINMLEGLSRNAKVSQSVSLSCPVYSIAHFASSSLFPTSTLGQEASQATKECRSRFSWPSI